jgi:hypothetical protein
MGTRRRFLAAGAGGLWAVRAMAAAKKKQAGGAPPGNVPKDRRQPRFGSVPPSMHPALGGCL